VGLTGRYDHTLDDKGRLSLPIRFREAFQSSEHNLSYITNHLFGKESCLAIYPRHEWERLIDRVEEKGRFDSNVAQFRLFYIGGAQELEIDKQGRVLIPADLRAYARLEREVTLTGQVTHVQIWDRARLREVLEHTIEGFAADPASLSKLGL
jgi:MraZ protein